VRTSRDRERVFREKASSRTPRPPLRLVRMVETGHMQDEEDPRDSCIAEYPSTAADSFEMIEVEDTRSLAGSEDDSLLERVDLEMDEADLSLAGTVERSLEDMIVFLGTLERSIHLQEKSDLSDEYCFGTEEE
jgi:hypothetical protein